MAVFAGYPPYKRLWKFYDFEELHLHKFSTNNSQTWQFYKLLVKSSCPVKPIIPQTT